MNRQGGSMNANKHTPGPWHRNVSARYPVYAGTDKTNWKPIAGVLAVDQGDDRHDGSETNANLNLIAAAPELLDFAALIARMKTEDEMGENSPASEDWIATLNELIASARPIVAKAIGTAGGTP